MFRALQPSEAPGSGGVLASCASAGQRRLSARGVEPAGRGSRPGVMPFGVSRMTARAIGGTLAPRLTKAPGLLRRAVETRDVDRPRR
jgi:hypothetical protein